MPSTSNRVVPVLPDTQEDGIFRSMPAAASVGTDPPALASPAEAARLLDARRLPAWKRGIDLAGATFLIAALSPLLAGLAVAIRITSGGPIFFRQQRHGLGGELFTIWKFRTLQASACSKRHQAYVAELARSDTPLEKIDNHADLIPLGRWYRAFGLDELPQLLNVLRGDMSLVGPRPTSLLSTTTSPGS